MSNQFDVCIRALEQAGCGIALTKDTVRVRLPSDPNDGHAAPDGEEHEYARAYFTLMVSHVFLKLAEQEIIDAEGDTLEEVISGP